jgi:penicillin-binding protein 1C
MKIKFFLVLGLFIFIFTALSFLSVSVDIAVLQSRHSTVIRDRNSRLLRVFLNDDEQYCFPPDKDPVIPENLSVAVVTFEDKRFFSHSGIDFIAATRAFKQNLSRLKIVSGASTLTMQVARLMENRSRTVFQKLKEAVIAFKLERRYTKEEILSLYLNYAPYGGNIYGIEAASWRYFRKRPSSLSWAESAVLAVLPNSPALIHPGRNREILMQKRNGLLFKLHNLGYINKSEFDLSVVEPLPEKVFTFEFSAPHLSRYLHNRNKGKMVDTTIDYDIQKIVEQSVSRHQRNLRNQGIKNSSVLVVETESGEIIAWVGSGDFFDIHHGGQVDGVISNRSSGSVLKPFLYALAFDQGYLAKETLIKDIPSYFGTFQPINADHSYRGVSTAEEALTLSLNVPAVRVLNMTGVSEFYNLLKNGGMTTLFRHPDDYGLSLVLGGAETTLYDLAVLYRGLANGGVFSDLKMLLNDNEKQKRQILSSGACYITLEILKNLYRPGSEYYWEQFNSSYPLAWKTGTSYGQRDGWAVGVSPKWTVAVWSGNFDGSGNPDLTGARSSGPLLFDVFNSLPKDRKKIWFDYPKEDLSKTVVCTATGFQATDNCLETSFALTPKNAKPLRLCPYHKTVYVTNDEKHRVNSSCWEPGNYKGKSFLVFPPDVSHYMAVSGFAIETIPPWKNNCNRGSGVSPVSITYPLEGSKIFLPKDFGEIRQKIVLQAAHASYGTTIFWYLNKKYLGQTDKSHEIAVTIEQGKHSLQIVDESGYSEKVVFEVFW